MASTQQSSRPLEPISNSATSNSSQLYDLVCIGFGPAQIATAIANRESQQLNNVLFLERKPAFSWYPSSQLPRGRLESPFIYDLATTRNPRSHFSYVNYLQSKNRLIEFMNSDRMEPLRVEFEDYLRWCAGQFNDQVRYGNEVVGVAPEKSGDYVKAWNVAVRDGSGKTYMVRARNIIAPSPSSRGEQKPRSLNKIDFEAGQRIISTDDYAVRRNELRGPREPRLDITVVGSSQQSIEILDDLLSCPRLGNVTIVTENETLAPLRILSDEQAPEPRLCSIWAKPSSAHKSNIPETSELIQTIYMRAYEKKVASKGQYMLRVVLSNDAAAASAKSQLVISETAPKADASSDGVFLGLDALVLGCRQKGDSLEEVQFKRGAVAEGCRMWMMSANSEGGRSLAKDVAVRAGEVVSALAAPADEARDGMMVVSARM